MTKIASLCVFAGSKKGEDPAYAAAAEALGREMAKRGIRLVYGGGDIGLMSILARAVLAGGGQVMGVIPEFLRAFEVGDPGVQELIVVDSMHERKAVMFQESDAVVVLPGGLGRCSRSSPGSSSSSMPSPSWCWTSTATGSPCGR